MPGDLVDHAHGRFDERIHVFGVDLYHDYVPFLVRGLVKGLLHGRQDALLGEGLHDEIAHPKGD